MYTTQEGQPQGTLCAAPAPFEVSGERSIVMPAGEPFVLQRRGSEGPADKTWDPGVKLTL